jgi:polyhydroxyalkanoate synthesis regulator phasin
MTAMKNKTGMEDLFKKFMYTGIGLAAYTAEKFQKAIDGLVKENKMSSDEGKKVVDDFVKNMQTKREEFESQIKSITERVVRNFEFASAHDLKELQKRIQALEAKVEGSTMDKPAKTTTAVKKAPAKV